MCGGLRLHDLFCDCAGVLLFWFFGLSQCGVPPGPLLTGTSMIPLPQELPSFCPGHVWVVVSVLFCVLHHT